MKRKIFSKLLMVALVIAAVGSFVSCKDYDDDINNLQKQIDNAALKSSVDALQSTLETKIAAAQSAAQAAQTAADNAAKTAGAAVTKAQLDDAISAAKSAAATAANEYADKVAAAAQTAAAQKAYDDAKAYVDAEVAKVTAAIPSEAAIKAIADASAAALDEALATELKAWVNEQIDAIDVKGQVDEAVADAISKIDTATANVNAIWSAVTEVEIVLGGQDLLFYQGKQAVTYTFGKETGDVAAAQYQEYTKGEDIIFRNNVLVRVNPVNATFNPADVKLVNSLGENLNGIVKVQKVEKYNQLITRADETGLWMITFAREDAATDAQFANATKGAEINGTTVKRATGKAAYAIAINNEQEAAAKRFVVTDYFFGIRYGEYQNTNTLGFTVNGEAIATLKNRWDGNKVVAEDETKAQSPADYVWAANTTAHPTPAADIVLTPAASKNVANDARVGGKYVYVKVDEPFEINGIDMSTIDYYYVVLDKDCAIESNPSEVRAWTSYEYDGINTKVESGKPLQITIKSTGSDPNGDIIGFRVFAVNYDGLLADPDGRAFYVQVGEKAEIETITKTASVAFKPVFANIGTGTVAAPVNGFSTNYVIGGVLDINTILATGVNNVTFACDFKSLGLADDITLDDAGFPASVTATAAAEANNKVAARDITVYINYLTSNQLTLKGQAQEATNVNEVAYVSLTVANPEDIVNGKTITTDAFEVANPDTHNSAVAQVNFKLTKGTIDSKPAIYDPAQVGGKAFSWKSDYTPVGGVYTLFPNLDGTAASWGAAFGAPVAVNMTSYTNNLRTAMASHAAAVSYTYGDYSNWITFNGVLDTDYENFTDDKKIDWTATITDFDGTLYVDPDYVSATPTIGKKHTVGLTVIAEGSGQKLSKDKLTSAPAAPDYTVIDTNVFFDNILNYEEYSSNYTYDAGAIGADQNATMKANSFWLSWNNIPAAGCGLKLRYNAPGYTTGKITTVASVNWAAGTYVTTMAGLLNVAKNTAVAAFGPATYDETYYVSVDWANAKVVSENGAVDEYVKIIPAASAAAVGFVKTTGVPTKNMNLTLEVTATDAFGFKHVIEVPFLLDVNN